VTDIRADIAKILTARPTKRPGGHLRTLARRSCRTLPRKKRELPILANTWDELGQNARLTPSNQTFCETLRGLPANCTDYVLGQNFRKLAGILGK
jgi:hypothetical protein